LEHIPESAKTPEICAAAVDCSAAAIAFVPLHFHSEEMINIALSAISLESIPAKARSKKLYLAGLSKSGNNLRLFPADLITSEICTMAITKARKHRGQALRYVPEQFKSRELCKFAVNDYGKALIHVPREYRDEEICRIAYEKSGGRDNGVDLAIPEELRKLIVRE
jgi:hypothetical protein